MTTVLMMLTAMMAAADPPPLRHKLGLIPPSEAQYQKALDKQKLKYEDYAKGRKQVLPARVDLSGMLPPPFPPGQQDQDCVGWAMAYAAKSYFEAVKGHRRPDREDCIFSPMYIYSQRKNRDAEGDKRDGMNPLDGLEILEQKGCATWAMMPYDKARVNDPPPEDIILKSYPFQIANHMIIPPTVEAIKVMLANNKVVVISIAVTPAFEELPRERVFKTHDPSEIRGYHAICAVGYDDSRRAIRLMNSWGDKWCDSGFCWISYDLFGLDLPPNKGFCCRGFVFVEAPTVSFAPKIQHAGGGDTWKLELIASADAIKDVVMVTYVLPDPFKPSYVTKSDPDTRFAIESSEVNPSASALLVPIVAIIYTRSGFQLARTIVVPCGGDSGSRPVPPGGVATVIIPELRGSAPNLAALRLSRLGLHSTISTVHKALPGSEDVARGRVARQYPEPRTRAARGGTVVLFVTDQP